MGLQRIRHDLVTEQQQVDLQCHVSFRRTAKWIGYTYICSFLGSFPIWVMTEYRGEFSVLCSRSLLVIYFIYKQSMGLQRVRHDSATQQQQQHVYMSIPVSQFVLPLPGNLSFFFTSVALFCRQVCLYPFKKWHTLFLDHVSACGSPRLRAPKDGHCLIPSCFPGACYGAQIITHAQQLFAKWKRIQWYVQIEKSRLIFEDTWVLCTGHRSLLPLAKASTLFSAPSHYPSQSLLSLCFPPQGLPWWLRP